MTSRRPPRVNTRAIKARRQKLGGLAFLVAILGAVWGRNVWLEMPRSAGAAAPETTDSFALEDDLDDLDDLAGVPPIVRLVRGEGADRDPFTVDAAAYVQREVAVEPEPAPLPDVPDPVDPNPELLRALHLQGTFFGDEPRAMINGRTLRVGDTIRGFRLDSVQNRRVILVKDGVRCELEM